MYLSEVMQKEKIENVLSVIQRQKGRFFSIEFITKDGHKRTMVCKTISPYPYKHGNYRDNVYNSQYRVVMDVQKNAIRVINLKTASKIRASKKEYGFFEHIHSLSNTVITQKLAKELDTQK